MLKNVQLIILTIDQYIYTCMETTCSKQWG